MKSQQPAELKSIRLKPITYQEEQPVICVKKNLQRRRDYSEDRIKKVQQKQYELFHQNEVIQEYLYDILTDRTKKCLKLKQHQLINKAKYACELNYRWKQKVEEQKQQIVSYNKGLELAKELIDMHIFKTQEVKRQSQSFHLPPVQITKRRNSEPKQSTYLKKMQKIVNCSYIKELNQLKRSQEIADKLEKEGKRIMSFKTMDCRDKFITQF
ncbi:hypothetical protein pb186bvf_010668 [Paramecium bursaria]